MRTPDAWSRKGAVSTMLLPVSSLYGLGTALRTGRAPRYTPPVPALCVGNLTAGGAGKTPVVLSLAQLTRDRGRRPFAVSRGYGGRLAGPVRVDPALHTAREVGDEPLLLAGTLPTVVARDRAAGARAAVDAGADILLLDDGHQNPAVAKALSLVVVDGGFGFGNGRIIPSGPLREPVGRGLARADAVVVLGNDSAGAIARCRREAGGLPLLEARFVPAEEAMALHGRRVVAFAGIGRPDKFFDTVKEIGADLAEAMAYPDHYPFPETEIMFICELAQERGAIPVCTEKDYMRLPPDARLMVTPVPVTLEWRDPDALDRLLAPVLGDGPGKRRQDS